MKVFTEKQKFNQSLVYIGISICLIVVVLSIIHEWKKFANESLGEQIAAIMGLIIILLVIILFTLLKLETKIDEYGVKYKFYPFHGSYKYISWSSIAKCYIREYSPISEYGGWGIKSSFKKKIGNAYTTKGSIGLQLILKNGKKILIGTQKKEELERVLTTYKHKIETNEL
ncbi:hypothetical protein MHL31_15355 [Lutibacter sp. A80]|uniref:hypothetical protein n=1 Tax=Lutibacter sp. A80 TaxID=2918453 RepID=UPI001F06E2F6|nr:hypothetical protein [Lutibacter sp. A80]UMB60445.1 hypothetical protein MHL31_15355 [Lutibacter sp. A80]